MLPSWLWLASALSATPEDAARDLMKGSALYRSCKAEVRLMDLPALSQATQPDLIDGSFCIGFVNGFTGNLSGSQNAVCPAGVNTGAVVRTYVAFMDKNPEFQEQDRRIGLRLAMQEAYPCPASQEPRAKDPSGMHPEMI